MAASVKAIVFSTSVGLDEDAIFLVGRVRSTMPSSDSEDEDVYSETMEPTSLSHTEGGGR